MKQAKGRDQWDFGVKAHIGAHAGSNLVCSVVGTGACFNELTQTGKLLHDQEGAAYCDAGYQGARWRTDGQGPSWYGAMRRGPRRVPNRFINAKFVAE